MIKLKTHANHYPDDFESDEKRYDWQMNVRANYLILGDRNVHVPIDVLDLKIKVVDSNLTWINRGELIAGSFMSNISSVGSIKYKDIDIYFKSKLDADNFVTINNLSSTHMFQSWVAYQVHGGGQTLNLIHGVAFEDAKDLISHFDIRACSIAYDPQTNLVHAVRGAIFDVANKRIVFNPVPHNTTVARMMKYAQRGFDMDPYQRLFFSELIKSDMYNTDLELSTGYRAVHK